MTERTHFDFSDLFHADEYLYFMEDTLRGENTPGQVGFIEKALGMEPPMRVLDLGCGHGRHSVELALRGYKPVGIDLVAGFIEVAKKSAADAGVDAQFAQGDLRSFRAEEVFDRAICMFDVFGFFEDDDQDLVLYNAFSALAKGGKLLLDLRTRELMTRLPPVSIQEKPNGDFMVDRLHFDIESGRIIDRRTFVRDGKARTIHFSVRLYSYTEIRSLLRQVGFTVEAAYGGFDGAPLSLDRNRTLIVASKPG